MLLLDAEDTRWQCVLSGPDLWCKPWSRRFGRKHAARSTCNSSAPFSDSGDSGSLIVDDDRLAIGLLFAGGDEGGRNGKGLTYANPLRAVLDALQVDLEL